jgi:hypothetical protein
MRRPLIRYHRAQSQDPPVSRTKAALDRMVGSSRHRANAPTAPTAWDHWRALLTLQPSPSTDEDIEFYRAQNEKRVEDA